MSSAADDGNDLRSASSGATRTPPPRTRRGAPTSRPALDELDSLDDLLDPATATVDPEPTPTQPLRGKRTSEADPPRAPEPSKTFDWDDPDSTSFPDATVLGAASDAYGDPIEPEVEFEPPASSGRPARAKAAKRPERRFRQTVQKIDLWSVTKMALCFYASAMGVVVVSLVALWVVADSAGIIDNVESFIGDLFSSEDFQFISSEILRGAALVGIVIVALMVAFTVIAASFYNIFAELFGGVEIIIREEEQPPKR